MGKILPIPVPRSKIIFSNFAQVVSLAVHTGEEEVSVLGREVTVKRRLRPSEERPYLVVHLEQHLDEGAPAPVYQKGDKVKSIYV